MAFDKEKTGIISNNRSKSQPKHPDVRGDCVIDGVEYWIAGWFKEGQYGPYTSLAFTPKDDNKSMGDTRPRVVNEPSKAPRPKGDNFDDDIPFN